MILPRRRFLALSACALALPAAAAPTRHHWQGVALGAFLDGIAVSGRSYAGGPTGAELFDLKQAEVLGHAVSGLPFWNDDLAQALAQALVNHLVNQAGAPTTSFQRDNS